MMKKIHERIRAYIINRKKLSDGWKGASIGLLAVTMALFMLQSCYIFYSHGIVDLFKAAFLIIIFMFAASFILTIIFKLIKHIPNIYFWAFFSSLPLLCLSFFGQTTLMIIFSLIVAVICSILGSLLYKFIKGHYSNINAMRKITAILLAAIMIVSTGLVAYWTISQGSYKSIQANASAYEGSAKTNINIENPSNNGKFNVNTLSYGSGKDLHNARYSQNNTIATKTVDGSKFVEGWSKLREKYLGFGPEEMPINGMVWYPEGKGSFPLVIIAHGNHLMTEESEPGYEYLGKLLASRGFIAASIDENFLNTSLYDDLITFKALKEENDARAFVILEHIKVWEQWNNQKDNPFYNKVDMNRIALIGHSRGGEAVAIAANFNKLKSYPDNGNVKFNYNFNIKSVVAIAPTDGQYKPSGKDMSLEDINYLVLQGAHDMDVSSFSGSRQYERVGFSEGTDYFKAAVYISRANHGQFNNVWGKNDSMGLGNKFFNLKQLLSEEEQQQIAKVLISSFLEATLNNKTEYRDIFKDINNAQNWIPKTTYISNYFDSKTKVLCSFDEDIDINTATISNGGINGENFKLWKESKVKMKNSEKENSAVSLEWDRSTDNKVPVYSLVIPEDSIKINGNSSIVFSIADNEFKKEKQRLNSNINLTVQVKDKKGNEEVFSVSLHPIIEGKIIKTPFSALTSTKEPVFQSYEFKLEGFRPGYLNEIKFVFDKTEKGQVLIDDIGIRD